jgi:D-lactate dehydrogenase
MKTTILSTHKFKDVYLLKANKDKHQLKLLENGFVEETVFLSNDSKALKTFT